MLHAFVPTRASSQAMPTLATIDGIKVTMYYADHEPAHFHAIAGEDEIVVGICRYQNDRGPSVVRGGLTRSGVGPAAPR